MADTVSSKRRSEIMRNVKGKDTTPEIKVRKYLFEKGLRYRLHVKKLPGSPDIIISRYKTVVFINGCFWHRHKNCKRASIPSSNKRFWEEKFQQNIDRDKRNLSSLKKLGWKALVLWQCEIEDKFEMVKLALDGIVKDGIKSNKGIRSK